MKTYSTDQVSHWDYESDIIVVGFGGAGACAAIEAKDAGSEVLLLERQPEARHYSNTRMSGGGFHSPDPSGNRAALKEYAKALFSGENLPWKFEGEQPEYSDALAELWAEYAPQNAAFMCSLDPDFRALPDGQAGYTEFPGALESKYRVCNSNYIKGDIVPQVQDSPRTPRDRKQAGEAFHQCLLFGLTERNVPIHYDTRAQKLLHGDDGSIIGVQATCNGKDVYYKARKAVILTSGGYEYNKALRSAFLEGAGVDGWAFYGTDANTGDGIVMGMESGAALSKAGSAAARLISSFPDFRSDGGIRIGVSMKGGGRPNEIIVDNFGNRFCNERDITKDPVRYISYKYALHFDVHKCLYPRLPAWFVFDETLRLGKSLTNSNVTEYYDIPWSQDNHEAIERGWILKADTIEELGQKIKAHQDSHGCMDVENLCNSVKRFNEFCAAGEDQDFQREQESLQPIEKAPFYAIALFPGGPNTKGGLKANEKRQVVDWHGNVIPRLYAAGEISSVFKFLYQAGGNVAECIVCGRVAGINAAQEKALD